MIDSQLISNVSSRTFWDEGSELSLLPKDNLTRFSYIKNIDKLTKTNVIVSVMGQRRCGKSVIARQYIKYLWQQGISRENILYINFFLKPLIELRKESTFLAFVEWWVSNKVNSEQQYYLILDEAQELENWDENIASIFEDHTINCQIILTGSNSKMLTENLSTELGGRYISFQVFPFSFFEYCDFTKTEVNISSLRDYITTGGMPEVIKTIDEEQRERLIADIINSTVKHDIIARYNPTNPKLLNDLIDYCKISFSKELSISNIEKQRGTTLVSEYLSYMEDVFFISLPDTYSYRAKDILKRGISKLYLGDLCVGDYKKNTDWGRLLENLIFNELRRQNYKVQRYFAYKNRNLEIDFHAEKQGKSLLIQVCWLLGDYGENKPLWEREFGNLEATNLNAQKYVISLDENVQHIWHNIIHLNIIDFLKSLNNNNLLNKSG